LECDRIGDDGIDADFVRRSIARGFAGGEFRR
jgi:Fe-S cluster assembly ATPase SufC